MRYTLKVPAADIVSVIGKKLLFELSTTSGYGSTTFWGSVHEGITIAPPSDLTTIVKTNGIEIKSADNTFLSSITNVVMMRSRTRTDYTVGDFELPSTSYQYQVSSGKVFIPVDWATLTNLNVDEDPIQPSIPSEVSSDLHSRWL